VSLLSSPWIRRRRTPPPPSIFIPFRFSKMQIPLPATPLFCHVSESLGGVAPLLLFSPLVYPERSRGVTRHSPLSAKSFVLCIAVHFRSKCFIYRIYASRPGWGYPANSRSELPSAVSVLFRLSTLDFSTVVYPEQSREATRLPRATSSSHLSLSVKSFIFRTSENSRCNSFTFCTSKNRRLQLPYLQHFRKKVSGTAPRSASSLDSRLPSYQLSAPSSQLSALGSQLSLLSACPYKNRRVSRHFLGVLSAAHPAQRRAT
jgi:hypothetical protein